jgi:hypothetical protein
MLISFAVVHPLQPLESPTRPFRRSCTAAARRSSEHSDVREIHSFDLLDLLLDLDGGVLKGPRAPQGSGVGTCDLAEG